jgi:hypothetical protein
MSMIVRAIRSRRTILAALLLVLVCSLAVAYLSGSVLRFYDEQDYNRLGDSLLHRHTFAFGDTRTVFRPPGYSFVLAAVYALVDNPLAGKVFNCFALLGTSALLVRLSARLQPGRTALAPLAVVCYPLFLFAASTLYPQTLAGLLLIATLLLVAQEKLFCSLAAGVTFAWLCLTVPSFLFILPLLLLYLMYQKRHDRRQMWSQMAVLGLAAVLFIAPWTLRNKQLTGYVVLISANSGYNLAIGNSSFTPADGSALPNTLQACPWLQFNPNEAEADRDLSDCAKLWIRTHPAEALRLYAAKVVNYFNFRNEISTSSQQQKPWQGWLVAATYYPLLLLAIARLGFWRRYRMSLLEALLYVIYFGNACLAAVFFTRLRFRIPFDLLLIAIDAAFVAWLMRKRSSYSGSGQSTNADIN